MWTGSLLNCTGNEIILRHSEFVNGSVSGECNNGEVTAHNVRVEVSHNDQCYSSQLNIILTKSVVNNKTIQCLYVVGTREVVINTHTVQFTTGEQ